MIEIMDHDSWLVMLDWLEDQGYDVQPYRIVRQATVRISENYSYHKIGYGNGFSYTGIDGNGYSHGLGYGSGSGNGDGDGDCYGYGNGDGRSYNNYYGY